jgi:hypothetical protein
MRTDIVSGVLRQVLEVLERVHASEGDACGLSCSAIAPNAFLTFAGALAQLNRANSEGLVSVSSSLGCNFYRITAEGLRELAHARAIEAAAEVCACGHQRGDHFADAPNACGEVDDCCCAAFVAHDEVARTGECAHGVSPFCYKCDEAQDARAGEVQS